MDDTTPPHAEHARRATALRRQHRWAAAREAWAAAALAAAGAGALAEAARAHAEAARCDLFLGHTQRAAQQLEGARLAAETSRDATALAVTHTVLAEVYRAKGSARTAVGLATQAVETLAESETPEGIDALLALGHAQLDAGLTGPADAMFAEASEVAHRLRTPDRALRARLGRALARLAEAPDDAAVLQALQALVKRARATNDLTAEAQVLGLLGRVHVDLHRYEGGKAFHTAALERFRRLGGRPGAAASLGGLGLCKLGIGMTADAVPPLTQAIHVVTECGQTPAEIAWRRHLDHTLVLLDRQEARTDNLEAWVDAARKLGDQEQVGALQCELGGVWMDLRDPGAALAWYDQALATSTGRDDVATQAIDQVNRAHALLALGETPEARRALHAARALGLEESSEVFQQARDAVDAAS